MMKKIKLLLLLLAGNVLAQSAYNFYFLPLPGDEWTLGTPWLVWKEAGKDTMVKFSVDSRCGWYRIAFSGSPPNSDAWVWLNGNKQKGPDDQVGDKGLDEDPVEWKDGRPTPFNLITRLGEHHNLFFDPAAANEAGRWTTTTYPTGREGKCTYKFAAMIYHTNPTKNTSFYQYNEQIKINDIVDGIVKGIVKPNLVNGKMQYSETQFTNSTGQSHEWKEENFYNAFKSVPGINVQRCFDMPFTRRGDLWEFDALQLCPDGSADYSTTNTCGAGSGGPIGGFYAPNLMQDSDEYGDYAAQYAAMGGRGNLYQGDAGVRPKSCVNMWCFDRGWYGGDCGSSDGGTSIPNDNRSQPGTVGSLDWVTSSSTKNEIDSYMRTGIKPDGTPGVPGHTGPLCWQPLKAAAIGNGNNRDRGDIYDYGNPVPINGGTKISGNLANYMCFESAPATFTYQPGQEFLFRGDDDIWVFINNQLVVDVGGNHGPAPGYVKLDTIGRGPSSVLTPLKPDTAYPINIFFCDRRSTGSNVRISTNMYFAQSTGLYVDKGDGKNTLAEVCLLNSGGNGSCSAALSGEGSQTSEKLCGPDVNGKIEFYLINRKGDDRRVLSLNDPNNCKSTGNPGQFLCYGGIMVNVSNGTAKVSQSEVVGLPGTWYLYAKVTDDLNKDKSIEDVKVATITSATTVRMAWGDIKDGSVNGPTVTNICKNPAIAATGELVPVCFSGGDFSGNVFLMDDIDAIGGSIFRLDTKGFLYKGSRLKVFYDSLGTSPVRTDTVLVIPGGTGGLPKPSSGSKPGVLVLWVTGEYSQTEDTAYYKVNVNSRPATEEVTIKSVIPKLEWIKVAGSEVPIPPNQQKGSKWIDGDPTKGVVRNDEGNPAAVWVGELVKLHLRAQRDGKTCKTCNYDLSLTAEAKAGSSSYPQTDDKLVVASGLTIKNGEAALDIAGKLDVRHPFYAKIAVRGISPKSEAIWDSLQFEDPPVPYPETVRIFDINGDGIGDSLVIAYNRGFRADSLPNAIEVQWDKDTTILYGKGTRSYDSGTKDSVYTNKNITKTSNVLYWTQYLKGVTPTSLNDRDNMTSQDIKNLRDTIILRRGPKDGGTDPDVRFSRSVLTRSETGKIANWVSFETGQAPTTKTYNISLAGNIEDKIPAIVVSARYLADETNKGCGGGPINPCRDKVTLEFSEPVKLDTNIATAGATDNQLKNTFSYLLRDVGRVGWDVLDVGDLPSNNSMRYNVSKDMRPDVDGRDSLVTMYFERYRGDSKSGTPMPGDSVRFAARWRDVHLEKNILMDIHDNAPNIKEIGRQIEGRKPFTPEKIPIGEIDPNYPDYVKHIRETLERNGSKGYDDDDDSLFSKKRPVELLPVPPDWNIKDVMREYPGTIGILFNPDVFNELADLEDKYGPIYDGDITIYPRVFYHTNLGNYVADRDFSVKCDDPIFPRNEKNQPSCRDSRSKFYIAWDMKDFKGRYVGAGAYVGLYDFRWEVFIASKNITQRKENIERKVEMHGVKRVKKK